MLPRTARPGAMGERGNASVDLSSDCLSACVGAGIGKPLRAVNDNGAKIIDVGAGGACLDEIADPGKKTCGVVVRKKMGRIEAKRTGPSQRGFVDSGAGRVVGRARAAIGAVGVAGERRNARRSLERQRQGQGVFLVRA